LEGEGKAFPNRKGPAIARALILIAMKKF